MSVSSAGPALAANELQQSQTQADRCLPSRSLLGSDREAAGQGSWCSPCSTCTVAFPFCYLTLRAPKPLPGSYPQVLETVGDHLRKCRLDLGLQQKQVAALIGADTCTVTNWELNHTTPALTFLPAIIRFLGYAPWAAGASLGERLLAFRRERGLSQKVFASFLGVDPGMLSRWERVERVPTGRYARLAEAFLEQGVTRSPG